MERPAAKRFMSWRDLVITPAIEILILGLSLILTLRLHSALNISLFTNVVTFYAIMVILTIAALKIIRAFFPIAEGIYSYAHNPTACYIWSLHEFLCITNLNFQYINGLLPPPMRKLFYTLLGAKTGRGIISIGGRIVNPNLVSIEENALIGDDVLLTAHAVARISTDILILGKIDIKSGAIIGAKSMIMPGVTVGENSMVNAMSLVPMNTKIPPNQIWGGNPAVKIAELAPVNDLDRK